MCAMDLGVLFLFLVPLVVPPRRRNRPFKTVWCLSRGGEEDTGAPKGTSTVSPVLSHTGDPQVRLMRLSSGRSFGGFASPLSVFAWSSFPLGFARPLPRAANEQAQRPSILDLVPSRGGEEDTRTQNTAITLKRSVVVTTASWNRYTLCTISV